MPSKEASDDDPVLFAITDIAGLSYRVELLSDEQRLDFVVYDQPVRIGHAYCRAQGKTLYLADLCISDAAYVPSSRFRVWLRCVFRLTPPRRNYCGHGLGSALLQLVIDVARMHGFRSITGEVLRSDPRVAPSLLNWYRRHGFDVRPEETKPNVIASLNMELPPAESAKATADEGNGLA
jgi:GNAT superfamily N-acetyltransferase